MATENKLSRLQLKALVKTCLIEILQEGLGSSSGRSEEINFPMIESRRPQIANRGSGKLSPLDTKVTPRGQQVSPRPRSALEQAIITESGGNSMMADILADTAMTTLQTQLANDRPSHAGSNVQARFDQQEQFSGDPAAVFGEEVASKWASLAFAPSPGNKLL